VSGLPFSVFSRLASAAPQPVRALTDLFPSSTSPRCVISAVGRLSSRLVSRQVTGPNCILCTAVHLDTLLRSCSSPPSPLPSSTTQSSLSTSTLLSSTFPSRARPNLPFLHPFIIRPLTTATQLRPAALSTFPLQCAPTSHLTLPYTLLLAPRTAHPQSFTLHNNPRSRLHPSPQSHLGSEPRTPIIPSPRNKTSCTPHTSNLTHAQRTLHTSHSHISTLTQLIHQPAIRRFIPTLLDIRISIFSSLYLLR
jgi:hypothetical protein